MALVKCKNPSLYREWLEWLERNTTMAPYEQRTCAFFNSEAGRSVGSAL